MKVSHVSHKVIGLYHRLRCVLKHSLSFPLKVLMKFPDELQCLVVLATSLRLAGTSTVQIAFGVFLSHYHQQAEGGYCVSDGNPLDGMILLVKACKAEIVGCKIRLPSPSSRMLNNSWK